MLLTKIVKNIVSIIICLLYKGRYTRTYPRNKKNILLFITTQLIKKIISNRKYYNMIYI